MDFYNTLYWSNQDQIYTTFKSVYPPLNFIFLQAFNFLFLEDISVVDNGFMIRELGYNQVFPLLLIYVFCIFIAVLIAFRHLVDFKNQLLIFAIFILSTPFLIAIERGNLIPLIIPALSWYAFSSEKISKSIALAIMVNLKPYCIIFYIAVLINKKNYYENKTFLFLAPIFSAILFFSSGLILNQEFYLMPRNLFGFLNNSAALSVWEVFPFASSITSFGYLSNLEDEVSILTLIGYFLKILMYWYLIKGFLLIYKIGINFDNSVIFSVILITNYSITTGGYGFLFYLPVIALLYRNNENFLLSIIVLMISAGILDFIQVYTYHGYVQSIYLSGEKSLVDLSLTLGSVVRPFINLIALIFFIENLKKS